VAQLVEHHLAKVRVASSNLVIRSRRAQASQLGGVAERPKAAACKAVQSRVQIPSPPQVHKNIRTIGAAVAHFLDMEGVTGSIPVSSTKIPALTTGIFALSQLECLRSIFECFRG
jgi:hypothetical protein